MKKIIAIFLALVVLAVGGVGGFAYAQGEHEPITGQKLFGWGISGIAPGNQAFLMATQFMLTNPNCEGEITINRIAVIKGDGNEIYGGDLLVGMQGEELPNGSLGPHQAVDVFLPYYILIFELGINPANPPSPDIKDYWPDLGYYTFEVSWTGSKDGLPLTGSAWMVTMSEDAEGNYTTPSTSAMVQMVNMEKVSTKIK